MILFRPERAAFLTNRLPNPLLEADQEEPLSKRPAIRIESLEIGGKKSLDSRCGILYFEDVGLCPGKFP